MNIGRKINFKPLYLFILIAVVGLNSCMDEGYSVGDFWISLGFVDMEKAGDDIYQVITDLGDTLIPVANVQPYFEIYDGQRVLINYTILDDVDEDKTVRLIKVNSMQEVLYKGLLQVDEENSDSIGNDPVEITNMWINNEVLNVEFEYVGSGYRMHYINLVYENSLEFAEEPVGLELRHNAQNDYYDRLLYGIVSFDLKQLRVVAEDSVEFVIRALDDTENYQTYDGIYTY